MRTRVATLERGDDRLAVVAILVAFALALLVAGSDRTFGLFNGLTSNPSNTLATGTSLWFDANGTGVTICAGTNGTLTCPFGTRPQNTIITATFGVFNKWNVGHTFTLAMVNGTGPTTISSYVFPFWPGGGASTTIAAGTTVNASLVFYASGAPSGTYTGFVKLTDTTTGRFVQIPVSVTI